MNYFVLFSVVIIVVSLIVLISPLNNHASVMPIQEGFATRKQQRNVAPLAPVAAGQLNLSGTAGMADGSSDHKHLLDNLLKKQERLAEAFENRAANASKVSATTTKKKGIASTGADYEGDNVPIPVAGCNNNKCMKIKNPMKALDGNCINPPRSGVPRSDGLPKELDYSIKFCPAFGPKDGAYAEECLTCGYYKYTSKCTPNPNNPKKPCDYETYTFDSYNDGPMPGTTNDGGDDGGDDASGPNCSTCKYNVNKTTKCVLPGCYSADDGNLPFPDGDYNFAEGCFYYNPDPSNPGEILPGMEGREPGYYCPPITKGMSYDAGGGSNDPCYTNSDGSINYAAFMKMDKICSNDKQKSKQNFVPDNVDDNPMNPRRHKHEHSGNINVYHHHASPHSTHMHMQNNNQRMQNNMHNNMQNNMQNNKQHKHMQNNMQNNKQQNQSNAYQEPIGGATVLGYL